jgi:xanthine dehydrogenase accessory factor
MGQAGHLWGSIGGGAIEYQAGHLAQQLLQERRSLLKEYHLSHDLGMICGGEATVFYRFIAAEGPLQELCASILRQTALNRDLWLITRLDAGGEWQMGLYSKEEGLSFINLDIEALQPCFKRGLERFQAAVATCYVEPIHSTGRVLVFGGGHVAQALVPLLAKLDFACWVLDDRPEFASSGLFPEAKRIICGNYEDINRYVEIQPADFIVVMTHGHTADYLVQKQAMQASPAYIGVIGSKNKIKAINERLVEDGYTAEEIACVHAPIGLPIKAETPAEIAVSIAGELIRVRAGIRD